MELTKEDWIAVAREAASNADRLMRTTNRVGPMLSYISKAKLALEQAEKLDEFK